MKNKILETLQCHPKSTGGEIYVILRNEIINSLQKTPSKIKKAILYFDSQLKQKRDCDAIQDEAVRIILKKIG